MCDCRSHNRPDWGGSTPEVVVDYRQYFPDSQRDTICVDACIVDAMMALWQAGVRTGGCCCGHNRQGGPPSVFITDPAQAVLANDILAADGRPWQVIFWAGSEGQ